MPFRSRSTPGISDPAPSRLIAQLTPEATAARRDFYMALGELASRYRGDVARTLTGAELKVFSQNGEDGVIAEVLRRIDWTEGFFVEIGAGTGGEGNCVALAEILGWRGVFVEGGEEFFSRLERRYANHAGVATVHAMVMPESIERTLSDAGVPTGFDVLSIDIDSTDYWIWKALERFRPRLVVIEYNAALGVDEALTLPADAPPWDGTQYFGASIRALDELAEAKGYRLVHTDLSGSNAFYLREDLAAGFPPAGQVAVRAANYLLTGAGHAPVPPGKAFVAPGRPRDQVAGTSPATSSRTSSRQPS